MRGCVSSMLLATTPILATAGRVGPVNDTAAVARRTMQATCTTFSDFSQVQVQIATACCVTQQCASGFPETCVPGACAEALHLMSAACRDFMSGGVYGSLLPSLDAATATCAPPPPPPPPACANLPDFNAGLDRINSACCADGCPTGLPTECNAACGAVLLPFRDGCSDFLTTGIGQSMSAMVNQAADQCHPLVPSGEWTSSGPCDPNPCHNGGSCTDQASGHRRNLGESPGGDDTYSCSCDHGFTGPTCTDASPPPPPAYCTARLPSLPDFVSSVLNTESASTFATAAAYFVAHLSQFDWSLTIPTYGCDVAETQCSTLGQDDCNSMSNGKCGWCACGGDQSYASIYSDSGSYLGDCDCQYDDSVSGYAPSCWGVYGGGADNGGWVTNSVDGVDSATFCTGTSSWHDEPFVIFDNDDGNNGLWKEALADISDGFTQIAQGLHPEPDGVESPISPVDVYTWLGDALGDVTYSGTGDWHTFGSRCYTTFDALDQIDMDHVAAIAEGEDYQEGDETNGFATSHEAFDVLKQVCAMIRDGFEDTTTTKPMDSPTDDCKLSMSNILDTLIAFFDVPSMQIATTKLASILDHLGSIVWTLRVDGETYIEREESDGATLVMQRAADVLTYIAQESLPQDGVPDRPDAVFDVWRFMLDLLDIDVAQVGHKVSQVIEALQDMDIGRDIATPASPCDDHESCSQKRAGDNWDKVCAADSDCIIDKNQLCNMYNTAQGAGWCEAQDGCMWIPESSNRGILYNILNGELTVDNINDVDPQTQCMFDLYHLLDGTIQTMISPDDGHLIWPSYEAELTNGGHKVLTPGCLGKWIFSSENPCLSLSTACSEPNKILSAADSWNPDEYDPNDNWLLGGGWNGRFCIWKSDYSSCMPVDLSYCEALPWLNPDASQCTADPAQCQGKSNNEKWQDVLNAIQAFLDKLQAMPEAPQPDGQCKASFLSIPDLLTSLDNDKIRRTAATGAEFLREIGTIDWRLPAPPRTDPIWDLLSPETRADDLEIGDDVSGVLNRLSLTSAMYMDDIAAGMPPTDSSTDKYAQSPWDLTEGLLFEVFSGDYVQIATQALELIDALQTVDWDAAIYGLTDSEDTDLSGDVVYALYLADHVSSQLHDGMLSYTPPDSPETPCADANPWAFPSIPDVLLKNIDAGRIKIALDNGAELFTKLSAIDWRVSTENFPGCSEENAVTCGTPQQLWSNDAGECSAGTYDKWSSTEACAWVDYDPITYEPKDCDSEQCCFAPAQSSDISCMTCSDSDCCYQTQIMMDQYYDTCRWHEGGDFAGQCHSFSEGDSNGAMQARLQDSSDPYAGHCKDSDGDEDPDFVAPYCWCTVYSASHYQVITANTGDLANTQFRDIANFFATLSAALPSDVAVNDANTEVDIVGWLVDALDNERWQVAAGHSNRMSADLDALDLAALYRKFDVEEYSGGIPDDQQTVSNHDQLVAQTVFDVWAAISAKLVTGLAE